MDRRSQVRAQRALLAFHARVDAQSAGALDRIASPLLEGSGWVPGHEAAWALLRALMTSPPPLEDDAPDEDEERLLALLSVMPPLPEWLDYLDRFPSSAELAGYRRDRAEHVRRWFPHVHPTASLIDALARRDAALDPAVARAIRGHVEGPYVCLACNRTLARAAEVALPSRGRRLAAATPLVPRSEWTAAVSVDGAVLEYGVRWADDRGYLRAFLAPRVDDGAPRLLRVTAVFASGEAMSALVRHPDDMLAGTNFGKLSAPRAEEIIGFYLGVAPGSG